MYKSPIDILTTDVVTEEENAVVRAVVKCGINVDKDELIKALAYDRGQYEKGYADASEDAIPVAWIEERISNAKEAGQTLIAQMWQELIDGYNRESK